MLTQAGIVLREKRGNLTYCRANRECPIFPELQGLMLKTAGLADAIRGALGPGDHPYGLLAGGVG